MRIAILNITGGDISGGYMAYLNELVPEIMSNPEISGLLVGLPEKADFPVLRKEYPSIKWIKMKTVRFSHSGIDREVKKAVRQFNPDVIYIPTARFWTFNKIPVINMNQNMEPYIPNQKGNPISERIRLFLLKKEGSRAFRKAHKVITISNFVKDTLVNELKIDDSKIVVIYHGHHEVNGNIPLAKPSSVPDKWKNDFIFTAGSIRPARGLEDILFAFNLLIKESMSINLVIAGETVPNMVAYRKQLQKYITDNNLTDHVVWAKQLDNVQMNWCYNNCNMFVMTSRGEACSIIALESIAHGGIIIASKNPTLPDI